METLLMFDQGFEDGYYGLANKYPDDFNYESGYRQGWFQWLKENEPYEL
jgi:hypothetical protein